jgi:dihydropteroate synthase
MPKVISSSIDLSRPQVMGILNITPDSFSDGGLYQQRDAALRQAEAMVGQGASILDIGGESTRPGAAAVSGQEELDRVIPVIEAIKSRIDIPLSIDTSKPAVMRAAVQVGVGLINDVNALRAEGALQAAIDLAVPVCLMHMQGKPRTMQQDPQYVDVVADVHDFLLQRTQALLDAGFAREKIVLDPGFGFGKTLAHNLALLRGLPVLAKTGYPLLIGISRKSMLGAITGRKVDQRMPASIAAAVLALQGGASILRVHDVAETVDALKVWRAVMPVCG